MTNMIRLTIIAFTIVFMDLNLFVPSNALAATTENNSIQRFAIIASANNGGAKRVQLRYAHTDAKAIAKVFADLGGLHHKNQSLLLEPSPQILLNTIQTVSERIKQQQVIGQRSEFIFYYSGHSDENGLLLGEERLDYIALKKALKQVNSDVQIAILDSCASGAFTRIKGGRHRSPFLVDQSSKVAGHAFLASSSADEAAQESDAIGGSYFTHFLVSALRGAGDVSRDKRVTLNEAYQFAFHETLARTEKSLNGAQHAAYNIKLSGAGDLVLTDLRTTEATLQLAIDLVGRLYIRDLQGKLALEMYKTPGHPLDLGLAAQSYQITLDQAGKLYQADIKINKGKPLLLTQQHFYAITPDPTVARGSIDQASTEKYIDIPFKVAILPGQNFRTKEIGHQKEKVRLDINFPAGETDRLEGVSVGPFMSRIKESTQGVQVAGIFAHTGHHLKGAQIAGIANIISGNMQGVQVAGIANMIGGNMQGIQVAGISNIAKDNLKGVQVASIANIVEKTLTGVQIATLANFANTVDKGIQIGFVNVSKVVHGVQLGFFNIAEERHGVAMGLFNIAKNGRFDVGIVGNEWGSAQVYVKSGMPHLYNIVSVSYFDKENARTWLAGWGVGSSVGLDQRSYLDFELLLNTTDQLIHSSCDFCETPDAMVSLRFGGGFRFSKHVALVAGLSINTYLEKTAEQTAPDTLLNNQVRRELTDIWETAVTWPGLFLGVEF